MKGAGHLVPQQQPERVRHLGCRSLTHVTDYFSKQAFVFLREFVLGNNQTGLVTNSSGNASVVGGENATLAGTVLPGQLGIFVGSGTTQSTYTYPSATIAAWDSFFASVTSTSASPTKTGGQGSTSGAGQSTISQWSVLAVGICLAFFMS